MSKRHRFTDHVEAITDLYLDSPVRRQYTAGLEILSELLPDDFIDLPLEHPTDENGLVVQYTVPYHAHRATNHVTLLETIYWWYGKRHVDNRIEMVLQAHDTYTITIRNDKELDTLLLVVKDGKVHYRYDGNPLTLSGLFTFTPPW